MSNPFLEVLKKVSEFKDQEPDRANVEGIMDTLSGGRWRGQENQPANPFEQMAQSQRPQSNPFIQQILAQVQQRESVTPGPAPAPQSQPKGGTNYDKPIGPGMPGTPGYKDPEELTAAERLLASPDTKLAEFAEKIGAVPKGHARKVGLREKAQRERQRGNTRAADQIEQRLARIEADERQKARGGKSLYQSAPKEKGSYLYGVEQARKAFGFTEGSEQDQQVKAILLDRSMDGKLTEAETLKVYDMVKDGSYVREYQRLARRNRDSALRRRGAAERLSFNEDVYKMSVQRGLTFVTNKKGKQIPLLDATNEYQRKGLIPPEVTPESERDQTIRMAREGGPIPVEGLQGQGFQDRRDMARESALASASAGAKKPFNVVADAITPAFGETRKQLGREIIEEGGSYRDAITASRQFQDVQGDFAGIALSGGASVGGMSAKALLAIDGADILAQLPGTYARAKTGGLKENLPELALTLLAGTSFSREALGRVLGAIGDEAGTLLKSPQFRAKAQEIVKTPQFQTEAIDALKKSGASPQEAESIVRAFSESDMEGFLDRAAKSGYDEAESGAIEIDRLFDQGQFSDPRFGTFSRLGDNAAAQLPTRPANLFGETATTKTATETNPALEQATAAAQGSKPSASTGLNKPMKGYIAQELRRVYEDLDLPENVNPKYNPAVSSNNVPVPDFSDEVGHTIQIPGGGTYTVYSRQQAKNLYRAIVGEEIDAVGKSPAWFDDADPTVVTINGQTFYGSKGAVFDDRFSQFKQVEANPKDMTKVFGDVATKQGEEITQANKLYDGADPVRGAWMLDTPTKSVVVPKDHASELYKRSDTVKLVQDSKGKDVLVGYDNGKPTGYVAVWEDKGNYTKVKVRTPKQQPPKSATPKYDELPKFGRETVSPSPMRQGAEVETPTIKAPTSSQPEVSTPARPETPPKAETAATGEKHYIFLDREGKRVPVAGPYPSEAALRADLPRVNEALSKADAFTDFDDRVFAKTSDVAEQQRFEAHIKSKFKAGVIEDAKAQPPTKTPSTSKSAATAQPAPKKTVLKRSAASVKDSNYAERYESLAEGNIYREVSPSAYWDNSYRNEGTFWATAPELATGQGNNKGVVIEFAPKADASFRVNTSKPGWEVAYGEGAAELKAANAQPTANNRVPGDIVSITVKKGTKVPPVMKANLESGARRGEWTREVLEDGSVKFTAKDSKSPQVTAKQVQKAVEEDPKTARAELEAKDTPTASQLDVVAMPTDELKRELRGTGVPAQSVKESADRGASKKLEVEKPDPKEVELQAGINPITAIKAADELEYDTSAGGSFRIEGRKPWDYNILDRLLAPLSIIGGDGKTIQLGTYERIGGDIGKTASETFRKAEQEMTALRSDWLQRTEGVSHYINQAFKEAQPKWFSNKKVREKFVSDFVDMVERPFDDPVRVKAGSGDSAMAKAIREHDKITEELRKYIIDSRRKQGFDTPDDWGITESGYFRHLFLGDIKVLVNGEVYGRAQTYAEAQKLALQASKEHPKAHIKAVGQNMMNAVDPTVRVSSGRFWRVVGNLSDTVEVPVREILKDIKGEIGKASDRNKFLGALMPRKGAKGYSKAYESVMKMHIAQVAKTQELSKLNKAITPIIEDIRKGTDQRPPLPGLADAMESHLSDLWGTPTKSEKDFGRLLEATPIIRNHVNNPAFAFRNTARRLTELQYWLRLKFNVRGSVVNAFQPLTTLWPYISTKDFAAVYADALKPSTRAALKKKGVLAGITKLEGDNVIKARERGDIFTAMSEVNRSVGYLFGVRQAKQRGLSEAAQHKHGLAWAEKVEFDNSLWNVQPVLRSPLARVLGQFKSFSGKNLETMYAGAKRQAGEPGRYTWGRRFKLGTGYAVIGGARATGPLVTAFGGFHAANALYQQLQAQGMSQEQAEDITTGVMFGAPSMVGQDLSGSVAIVDLFGNDPNEILVNYFGGPTIGTAISVGTNLHGAKDAFDREKMDTGYSRLTKAGKAATPYFRQGQAAYQLIESKGKQVQVRSGANDEFTRTFEGWRAWLYALGFSPVEQSVYWERREARIKKADSESYGYGASEKGAGEGRFKVLADRGNK